MEENIENMNNSIFDKVAQETQQLPNTRKKLLEDIENKFGKKVLVFATSPYNHLPINDQDAVMISTALHSMLSEVNQKGLLLLINSSGGSGLSAEKIINVCKSYANEYEVIIPNSAKSAATMIALGAKKIWMSKTSELGPIDPQMRTKDTGIPVCCIVNSYKELLQKVEQCTGRIEGYLQQLEKYDSQLINWLEMETKLSTDIVVKALRSGMLSQIDEKDIPSKISIFTDPEQTYSHGRMINLKVLNEQNTGLTIEEIMLDSDKWSSILELYYRIDYLFQTGILHIIETTKDSYNMRGSDARRSN